MSSNQLPIEVSGNTSNKLDDVGKQFVLRQIAQHLPPSRIRKNVRELLGINLSRGAIAHYRNSGVHEEELEQYRKEYEIAISSEQFASKRQRVREMSRIYHEFVNRRGDITDKERKTLMDAVNIMDKIDGIVVGRQKGDTTFQMVQVNKYSNLETSELIKRARELIGKLGKENNAVKNGTSKTLFRSGIGSEESWEEDANGTE